MVGMGWDGFVGLTNVAAGTQETCRCDEVRGEVLDCDGDVSEEDGVACDAEGGG